MRSHDPPASEGPSNRELGRRGERGELLEGRGEPLDRLDAGAEGGREAVHREAGCEVLQARGVLAGAGEVPAQKALAAASARANG